jgi:hypothetical protein
MKKTFLIPLGSAALGMGLFLLFKLLPYLPHAPNYPFTFVALGVVLTLPLAGAWLVFAGIRALRHHDWSPGKWTRVVFYLVVLDAAAIFVLPYFVKTRTSSHTPPCIRNLQQLDGATQQWALEHKKKDSDAPVLSEVLVYRKDQALPICPGGGSYKLGTNVMDNPTCSLGADPVMGTAHRLRN